MAPTTTKQWNVAGREGWDSLKFTKDAKIPAIGNHDVLVKFYYASLNYRDLIIPKGKYAFPTSPNVIPGSDGAGTVVSVGPRVTQFKTGDRVLTLFNQTHQAGNIKASDTNHGLGGVVDGTLRQYGTFEETGLVHMPSTLSFQEGSTLSCAAVTSWNALYGIEGRSLKPGHTVLTQGTGGVCCFGVQFAKAAGATVIATTSSASKAQTLKKLGADHVIKYNEVSDWGKQAKDLSPGGLGVDHILEVGGPKTMAQSLKAIKPEGVISIIGFLGGMSRDQPSFLDCLNNACTVRGVMVGSKAQFDQMNAAIDANNIKPVVDEQVFNLEDLKEAYQYLWDKKHFGKVTIRIDDAGA